MSYCANKKSATVIYKFKDGEEKRYTVADNNLPVDVVKEKVFFISEIETTTQENFEGNNPGSYAFTIDAPETIPPDIPVDIYLKSGVWDDYGGIGGYSTGYGIVMSYDGEPLLIGNGRSIDGTVTNVLATECYANITLGWRYSNGCNLKVSSGGNILYEEKGECPLEFEVVCDEECPKGYIKCESTKHPGYCCLPCKETANKIRALGGKLR